MSNISFTEIRKTHEKIVEMRHQNWIHHDLFSFQWWLLLAVLILPWMIWLKLVDKKRLKEIILFGSILTIIVMMLDDMGVELHLWSYPYQLTYLTPRLVPIDMGIIIVAHMLIYQYFVPWKRFVTVNIIIGLIFAFIFEPITVWLGIYKLESWRYVYSFPIYVIKAMLVKWLIDELISKRTVVSSPNPQFKYKKGNDEKRS